jgi:hypothetical protein
MHCKFRTKNMLMNYKNCLPRIKNTLAKETIMNSKIRLFRTNYLIGKNLIKGYLLLKIQQVILIF